MRHNNRDSSIVQLVQRSSSMPQERWDEPALYLYGTVDVAIERCFGIVQSVLSGLHRQLGELCDCVHLCKQLVTWTESTTLVSGVRLVSSLGHCAKASPGLRSSLWTQGLLPDFY